MIRINQIKLPIFEVGTDSAREAALLKKRASKLLHVTPDAIRKLRIVRRSVDAREKNRIQFVYTLDLRLHDSVTGPTAKTEQAFVRRLNNRNILSEVQIPITLPEAPAALKTAAEAETDGFRPVVVGAGPCGLFAALLLARAGLRPIVIERGRCAAERAEEVERFFETGKLDPDCNVQFGEGGAGTFSDGKLNTSIKGQNSYIRFVLETFVQYGAPRDILTDQKPHIGTDLLIELVTRMREDIERLGGEVLFRTKLSGLLIEPLSGKAAESGAVQGFKTSPEQPAYTKQASLCGVRVSDLGKKGAAREIRTNFCLLAIGHSARDTFSMLQETPISMEQKSFAMGLRVQHPQELIDRAMYGAERLSEKQAILGPASYKLTHHCKNGRSIYSFCMCPGGYVVNSSSEPGRLCVNGMSYHDRASGMANAALIVNVTPEDFPSQDVLAGLSLQRQLEEKAYALADGIIPYERYGEFCRGEQQPDGSVEGAYGREADAAQNGAAEFTPKFRGLAAAADLRAILPDFMQEAILEGMEAFGRQIAGYDDARAILAGIETRTSSPVRILRDDAGESSIRGLFPAGEGAGYAGGITSAAIDGLKAAGQLLLAMEQRLHSEEAHAD